MKNLTFYLIVIIIVLAGLSFTYYSLNKKNKETAKRMEENFYQTSKKQYQLFNLTLKEFKESMDSKMDSIVKKSGIKPKWLKQVTNNITYYTDTTISFILPEYEPNNNTYPIVDKQGCFEFSGFIKMKDTIPSLTIEDRKFNSDFTELEYMERDSIRFLGRNWANRWPWAKKYLNYKIIDNCTGEKKITKINIK